MDYVEQFMHWEYTDSLIREQESLQAHINNCLAINEGTPIFVLEAEEKKGIITRIKEFFNKIWVKFKEKLNAMVKNDKEYLVRYKDIIIGKECKLDVTMHNWFVGIRKFNNTIDTVIDEANNTFIQNAGTSEQIITKIKELSGDSSKTTKEDGSIEFDVNKIKNNMYITELNKIFSNDKLESADKNLKFSEGNVGDRTALIKNYYFGSDEEEDFTASDMNSNDRMSVVFNELYSADMLMKKLQALKNAHDKGMEKLNKALNTLQTGTVALQKESYVIEMKTSYNKNVENTDKSKIDNTQQNKAGENLGTATSNVKDTQSKAQQNVTDAGALNKELENKDKNNVDDAKGKQNISKYLTAYNATVEAYGSSITSVFAAMCTAREAMRKDFRTLVRAHVNSYLSDSEGNSTNKTSSATDQGTNVGKQEPNKSPDGTGSSAQTNTTRTNVVPDRGNDVGVTDDAGQTA